MLRPYIRDGKLIFSRTAIAKRLGVSLPSVGRAALIAGVTRRRRTIGTSLDDRLRRLIGTDGRLAVSLREAAAQLDCSHDTIWRALARLKFEPQRRQLLRKDT